MFKVKRKSRFIYILLGCSISLSTFADSEKITPAKITGNWKCTESMDYMGYDTETFMESVFLESGEYSESSKIIFKKDSEVANFTAVSTAQWIIKGSILSIEQNQLNTFETDNPSLNEKLNVQTALADPDTLEFVIKKLTPTEMILNLILFDTEIENLSRMCTR